MNRWELWFTINVIIIFVGMSIAIIDNNVTLASTTILIGMFSFIPCLYRK